VAYTSDDFWNFAEIDDHRILMKSFKVSIRILMVSLNIQILEFL
jgi:hypothetical protein